MLDNTEMVSLDLPIDVTSEILSRLPAKSLLRFKSVCKTWYALIKNPNFVEKHRKSNFNITSILVTTSRQIYLKDENFYKPIDFDFPVLPYRVCLSVMGTCNGLVCVSLSVYDSDLVICNPTTREFRLISPPKLPNTESDLVFFGFSSLSDDYKLVRVIYRISVIGEVIIKAEVYAMTSDIWVEIDVKMGHVNTVEHLSWYGPYSTIPVIINGVFYWEASSSSDTRVLSFDPSKGIFEEINIPISIIDTQEHCWTLIEFQKEVSLIVYSGERKFELWVLNENKSSWTWKLRIEDIPTVGYPVENLGGVIAVVGNTRNGELLVEERNGNDWKMLLYDLNSRETKSLPSFDVQGANNAYFYNESLISVNLRDEVADSDYDLINETTFVEDYPASLKLPHWNSKGGGVLKKKRWQWLKKGIRGRF